MYIPRATSFEFIGFQRYSLRTSPPQEISRAAKFALKSIPSDSLLSLRNDRWPNDWLNSAVYRQGDAKQEKDRDESEPKRKSLSTSLCFLRASVFQQVPCRVPQGVKLLHVVLRKNIVI